MSGPRRTVLANGLRIVTEPMAGVRSAAVGIWVAVGSRDEPADACGLSHFLEHLLFKGTDTRNAHDIAVAIDRVGGEMNAFTGRESTTFYARVPAEELSLAVEMLCDVLTGPALRADEIESERAVILDELAWSEDQPDERVFMSLYDAVYGEHPLGREVGGTAATVADISGGELREFHSRWYQPANLVVAAAGSVDHEQFTELVERHLGWLAAGDEPTRVAAGAWSPRLVSEDRPTEQVQLALAWPGLTVADPDRYALSVANQAVGGGLSSRLFQEVRERRGLAYSIYSSPVAYSDHGLFTVGTATAPEKLDEMLDVLAAEVDTLVSAGITADELEIAQAYSVGAAMLSLEDPTSRMCRLAQVEMAMGHIIDIDEYTTRIRAVDVDCANRVLGGVLGNEPVVSTVGPGDLSTSVPA